MKRFITALFFINKAYETNGTFIRYVKPKFTFKNKNSFN